MMANKTISYNHYIGIVIHILTFNIIHSMCHHISTTKYLYQMTLD